MKLKRFISVLLAILLVMAVFVPAGLAEGADQSGSHTAEPPTEQPAQSDEPAEAGLMAQDEGPSALPEDATVYFTVVFRDWDGSLIGDEQQIAQGETAVEPAHPTREGYKPDGWDKPFTNVQENLVVTAKYKLLESYTLTINYLFSDNGVAAQPYIAMPSAPM